MDRRIVGGLARLLDDGDHHGNLPPAAPVQQRHLRASRTSLGCARGTPARGVPGSVAMISPSTKPRQLVSYVPSGTAVKLRIGTTVAVVLAVVGGRGERHCRVEPGGRVGPVDVGDIVLVDAKAVPVGAASRLWPGAGRLSGRPSARPSGPPPVTGKTVPCLHEADSCARGRWRRASPRNLSESPREARAATQVLRAVSSSHAGSRPPFHALDIRQASGRFGGRTARSRLRSLKQCRWSCPRQPIRCIPQA